MSGPYRSTVRSRSQLRRVPPSVEALLSRNLPRDECWTWPGLSRWERTYPEPTPRGELW